MLRSRVGRLQFSSLAVFQINIFSDNPSKIPGLALIANPPCRYARLPDGMRRPVSRGMRYAPNVRRARDTMKRRPAMKKISTVRVNGNMIFKGHKFTIGLDLGDRWWCYCVLDEAGEILLEQKVATTPEAMKQIFEKIPRGLIARPERIL